MPKQNTINIESNDDLEKIEEDIIEAAEKAGKKNVIVNIFTFPHRALKRRWHVRYKFNKKHLVLDLIIAGAVLFLIGLNVFWWYGGFHYFTDELVLNIAAQSRTPRTAAGDFFSGQEISFSVDYINNNKFGLEDVVLSLMLPKRFELKTVSRSDFDWQNKTLKIGNLAPGANGAFEVDGLIWGALNEEQQFIVQASFYKTDKRGERLWGQFSQSQFYVYKLLVASDKRGSQFVPDGTNWPMRLVNEQVAIWPIEIINASPISYKNVKVAPRWDAELGVIAEKDWTIGEWPAGEKKKFDWRFKLNTGELYKPLTVDVYLIHDGEWLKQNEWSASVTILSPEFKVEHSVANGFPVDPGQLAEIVVSYHNDGPLTIENARISLELAGDYWDLAGADLAAGKLQNGKIAWSAKEWPQLALIQPRGKGEKTIKLAIKEYAPGSADMNVRSKTDVKYRLEDMEVEIDGSFWETKLNSNLSLLTYPMYFTKSGDQLGRGPLPPKAGEETKYWIFVKVINDINDVEKVKVTAVLPSNVVWTGKTNVPIGDPIQFDETLKTVSWQISKAPAKLENIGFAFEVGIIPTVGQKGIYPALISALSVSGVDKATGQSLEKKSGPISTKLLYDEIGKRKDGKVK
ncbi:hypothetical protein HZB94_04330 [Candidatus Falkowbacteria bacterium]|nr:hypothetical protein [Candidatus Falkowbacteria bacterium]